MEPLVGSIVLMLACLGGLLRASRRSRPIARNSRPVQRSRFAHSAASKIITEVPIEDVEFAENPCIPLLPAWEAESLAFRFSQLRFHPRAVDLALSDISLVSISYITRAMVQAAREGRLTLPLVDVFLQAIERIQRNRFVVSLICSAILLTVGVAPFLDDRQF